MVEAAKNITPIKKNKRGDQKSSLEIIERFGTQEEMAQLYTKLAEATNEIKDVPKNGYNGIWDYYYAKADDMYKEVAKVLSKKNVVILTSPISKEAKKVKGRGDKVYTEIYVTKEFSFNDGDTGAHITMKYMGYDIDDSGKFLYKAYTGAMKYFLRDNFLIDTGDADPELDEQKVVLDEEEVKKEDGPEPTTKPEPNDDRKNFNTIKDLYDDFPEIVKNASFEYLDALGMDKKLKTLNKLEDDRLADLVNEINSRIENPDK